MPSGSRDKLVLPAHPLNSASVFAIAFSLPVRLSRLSPMEV